MPKEMRICKACGKQYEACHTPNPGVFRWRDIACSYECAMKYIHDVQVARGEIVEEKPTSVETEVVAENDDRSSNIVDDAAETNEGAQLAPVFNRRRKK